MNKVERSLSNSASNLARRMEYWSENGDKLNPIISVFEERWLEVGVDITTSSLELSIAGSTGDFVGAITLLEEHGYTTSKEMPEGPVTYWVGYFNKEGHPAIWLYWSNKFCEQVLIGVEVKEVSVYELRCSGGGQ